MENNKSKKMVTIIVNGKDVTVEKQKISFEDIIVIALGEYNPNENTAYTVSYSKGEDKKPKGQLVKKDKVMVKEGMIFNVSRTTKS